MVDETQDLESETAREPAGGEEAEDAAAAPSGRIAGLMNSRLARIGAGGAALAIVAGVGFVFFSSSPDEAPVVAGTEASGETGPSTGHSGEVAAGHEGAASPSPAPIGEIVSLDTFIVNIEDQKRDRYLKLKTELEVSDSEVGDELKARMPQVRDLILSLLGSKSFEEVRTIEGKNFLREEILLRLNALLVAGKVRRVFFTEFVVQ